MSSTRKYLFGTTILVGMMAAAVPAFAQDAPPAAGAPIAQDEAVVDEIVVTGSRIRRDPTNAPTPLIQVAREQLLETGRASVIDYLAQLPALTNSIVPSDTTGANLADGGASFANLRSLGSGRTLTLIDGKRQVGSAGGLLAVDIDTIPRLLIENIEIITGGASGVYGADAVSGVLNFVTRQDFEGLEIDANFAQLNQGGGETSRRISALGGINLFDDRLNLYGFAEYEAADEVRVLDIDWLEDSYSLVGIDADPTSPSIGPNNDGQVDQELFSGLRTLSRLRWGQTTLANNQQPSPANDPDVPFLNAQCNTAFTSANCYSLDPTKTWVFEGLNARLANFGQRIGNTGASRTLNIGGDGSNPAEFGQRSRTPDNEAMRYQVGANYRVTSNITARLEAKYVEEDTFDVGQPVFFDVLISNSTAATATQPIRATNVFDVRLSDNAYLPANLRQAILANTLTRYAPADPATPGVPGLPIATNQAAQFARHSLFGPNRSQDNHRELQRYVGSLTGEYDQVGFVQNLTWDLSYVYGEATNSNVERGVDVHRFALAADAVVDTAGLVNGRPGEIVCRARLLAATPGGVVADRVRGGDLRDSEQGRADLAACTPLNIFGEGNQSAEALNYVDASINPVERNEQEQAIVSVSGELWDVFGAGPIGVALGAEYRREFYSTTGRDATTGDRFLFLNTGAALEAAEYDSNEYFAEIAVPLFEDSFMGEYAELSGSYRKADYSTVGDVEIYGGNLIYRPVQDITFKTSLNKSVRVPNLAENFDPAGQTFANGFVDACDTREITAPALPADIRANRIANCTALAQAAGFSFDFAGATAPTTDDYRPTYTSGIAGIFRGNPNLRPEESESFTFSTVFQPRWVPNLTLVLDYYEIEIEDVIASPSAAGITENCVSGPQLNPDACSLIFRNNPTIPFGVGAPQGDPIGGFIQQPLNYAKLQTRGLDFSARYGFDSEEMFGIDLGRFDYSIAGLWLIEQKDFLNTSDANSFVDRTTTINGSSTYPRVKFNTNLTWSPTDTFSVSWIVNWQSASRSLALRDFVLNADSRPQQYLNTGNFAVHDLTTRWRVRDDVTLRAGVTNLFDNEQPRYLGTAFIDGFDPYGTRFFIGLNYRPF